MSREDGLLIAGDPVSVLDLDVAVGEGTYGQVFKGLIRETGKSCAVKITEKRVNDEEMVNLEQEILILRSCEHFGVVGYMGSWLHERHNRIWMCLEYCALGSISDVMFVGEAKFSETEIKHITASILLALEYLHGKNVCHRDIKAANVLMTETGCVKLADFGIAAVLTEARPTRRTAIGAPYWMAPEVVLEQDYGTKCDIWSLGITCYECAETNPPHSDIHPMRTLFMIPDRPSPKLPNPSRWSNDFNDFLAKCLDKNPDSRPTCSSLLVHPFVKDTAMDIRIGVGRSKVLESIVDKALPIIRDFRKEEPEAISPSTAARDSRALSTRIYNVARVKSSIFDDQRPISNVYNARADKRLLSVKIEPDAVENFQNTGAYERELFSKVLSQRMIEVNEVMELLGQAPLTEAESEKSSNLVKRITTNFIKQLDDMI